MSERLFNAAKRKWADFLDGKTLDSFSWITDERERDWELGDQYDELMDTFCVENHYRENICKWMKEGHWYDTFADEYYSRFESEGD